MNINTKIPMDHHPETVLGDDRASVTARGALGSLYDDHSAILNAADVVRNKAELARKVEGKIKAAASKARTALHYLEQQRAKADAEIRAELTRGGLGPLGQEIRTYVRSLPESKRFSEITKMIDEGNRDTVAAIMVAPKELTGLDSESYVALYARASEMFAADQHATWSASIKHSIRVQRAVEHFEETMTANLKAWKSGDDAAIEALLKQKETA